MKKRVKISELKNHLSAYLRHVRRGHTVEVLDRETLIAAIVPVETTRSGIKYRPAKGRLQDVEVPPPLDPPVDVVALLREDRDAR
jgi:prevent-host-death family protein